MILGYGLGAEWQWRKTVLWTGKNLNLIVDVEEFCLEDI